MGTQADWDYALVLKGITPRRLHMAKLAEYLREWAGLLGDANMPVLKAIKQGSVELRAAVREDRKTETRVRLLQAKSEPDAGAARYIEALKKSMQRDAVSGQVMTSAGDVLMELNVAPKPAAEAPEYVVPDSGTIDGVVVGILGTDDTVHVRLQERSGAVWSIALRDFALARRLATHFRADPIRMAVHGTWRRTSEGAWEPKDLYGDGFEELDSRPVKEVFDELRGIPGNGWTELTDPVGFWKDLRGSD